MDIRISKQEIFREVEKRTSLEGYIMPDRYDGVWANSDRGELLDSYWIEGYSAVVQLLKRYINSKSVSHILTTYDDDEVLVISATMPARYNSLLDGSVSTCVKMMVACNILNKWFSVTAPEVSAKYGEGSKEYSDDLRSKLLYRIDPENTSSNPALDSVELETEEAVLSSAKTDDVNIETEEAVLSSAKTDDVSLRNSGIDESLSVSADTEPLVQYWGKCCRDNYYNDDKVCLCNL